jgi:choline monooxygenase
MRPRDAFSDVQDDDLAAEPLGRARTAPAAWCVEPRFHDLDHEAVIAASWQLAGSLSALEREGALLASVAGCPVIVVKGPGGALRAFANVCRHRGGPLAPRAGAEDVLQCRYHGWTYRTDGTLLGAPFVADREALPEPQTRLPSLGVEAWQGFAFVHVRSAAPEPLGTRLSPLASRLGRPGLAGLRFAERDEYELRCNWKVYVDNYLEGYHVPHVHPELMGVYDFRRYRTEVHDGWSVQVSPLAPEAEAVYGTSGGEALYAFLFPNLMLNVLPGRLQVNLVVPLAADRCKVVFEYYYEDVSSIAARERIEKDHAFSDLVQRQDVEICERVQEGLASGVYDRGLFCTAAEEGVHHFQQTLKAAYRRFLRPGGPGASV